MPEESRGQLSVYGSVDPKNRFGADQTEERNVKDQNEIEDNSTSPLGLQ